MRFLDLIFPKRCVSCGRIGRYICDGCRKTIIPIAPNECICPVCEKPAIAGITHPRCRTRTAPDGLTSFFYYKDTVRKAIHTIKYGHVSDSVREFVDCIPFSAYEIRSAMENPHALLVPIPLHRARERSRGFNQSEVLARQIAVHLRIACRSDILSRQTATTPQVEMKRKTDRLSNIKHAFAVRCPVPQDTKLAVLLFDDVFTTGATMREATRVLKRAGAKFVWAVTMAR